MLSTGIPLQVLGLSMTKRSVLIAMAMKHLSRVEERHTARCHCLDGMPPSGRFRCVADVTLMAMAMRGSSEELWNTGAPSHVVTHDLLLPGNRRVEHAARDQ